LSQAHAIGQGFNAHNSEVVVSGQGYYDEIYGTLTRQVVVETSVPEPATWAMMILGFCGLGLMAYRRKKNVLLFAAA